MEIPGHRPGTEDGSTVRARVNSLGRGEVRLQFVSAKDVAAGLSWGPHLYAPAGAGIVCG